MFYYVSCVSEIRVFAIEVFQQWPPAYNSEKKSVQVTSRTLTQDGHGAVLDDSTEWCDELYCDLKVNKTWDDINTQGS